MGYQKQIADGSLVNQTKVSLPYVQASIETFNASPPKLVLAPAALPILIPPLLFLGVHFWLLSF